MRNKRILIAFDGTNFSGSALAFGLEMAKKENLPLTGVFLQDISYMYLPGSFGLEPQPIDYNLEVMSEMMDEDRKEIDKAITRFRTLCSETGVKPIVHLEKGVPSSELISESLYADLIIIGQQTYFSKMGSAENDALVNEILEEVQCPMMVVPELKPLNINTIAFAYDGHSTSVWAFRQFNSLFGESYTEATHTILHAGKEKEEEPQGQRALVEYMKIHFPNVKFQHLSGKAEDVLHEYMEDHKTSMLVIGSHNKSFLGRILNPGHARNIIQGCTQPVFIACR